MNEPASGRAFDIGINDRLPLGHLAVLGLQNVFGMTGMFVFPGLPGRSFNLPAERIAYLYGMSFMVCGLIIVLQSVWLLRLPVVQGTYAGTLPLCSQSATCKAVAWAPPMDPFSWPR